MANRQLITFFFHFFRYVIPQNVFLRWFFLMGLSLPSLFVSTSALAQARPSKAHKVTPANAHVRHSKSKKTNAPKAPITQGKVFPVRSRREDPEPLKTRHYLLLKLSLKKNSLKILSIDKLSFSKGPQLIPRFRGRFEARLFAKTLLKDLLRFDFPLTAPASQIFPEMDPLARSLSSGVSAKISVRVPFIEGIDRLVIYDTLTKKTVEAKLAKFSKTPVPLTPQVPTNLRARRFKSR